MNIRDIAKISGVGVSTVSRVLNNHPDVKESTRENVLRVIKESNYVPNNSARILKQNTTKNIGVLVKGVFNPFFSELINVIGSKINEEKYTMILQQNDYVLGSSRFPILRLFERSLYLEHRLLFLRCRFESLGKEYHRYFR